MPCNLRVDASGSLLPRLVTRRTEKCGKGVFTEDFIEEGSLVEISHVIVFSADEYKVLEKTNMYNYVYGTKFLIIQPNIVFFFSIYFQQSHICSPFRMA
jgi:hypothetical protein